MEVPSKAKPRWTGRDSICLGLAVFVVINVIMCLWVAAISMSTARRQATSVFFELEKASVIEFNLRLQTKMSSMPVNVTGRLQPRHSECSRRLHFDGRMIVTTSNTSEMFVLMNHRGYRRQLNASDVNATCLTTQDIPPLHTLADTVYSAFRPLVYDAFKVDCKPLQVTFYDMPFVVCAEDWLRARLAAKNLTHSTKNNQQTSHDPVLIIHGKKSELELTVLSNSIPFDAEQPFKHLDYCEYLDAPMTSGESCVVQTIPGPDV
ncbi:unnamed protein product [Peronospora farinosa]|uniref:Transmembrane protein n=1 Tax=Peronospora farinosa TaxID=134698 RepID=A0AAV0TVD0_9STRA|nr:unnamed protein product [Peronospora farinosa]CAI5728034.1 unnamed protein product [Peronospora farinosa]